MPDLLQGILCHWVGYLPVQAIEDEAHVYVPRGPCCQLFTALQASFCTWYVALLYLTGWSPMSLKTE
jgi:hypothetical protein